MVDLNDLNAVLNNFGLPGLDFHQADTNDDGVIDLDDLNNVLNNFGFTIFDTVRQPGL